MDAKKILAKTVENWPAKVLSLGLAIILFVFNRMSTLEERFFSVPLSVELKGPLMPSSSFPRMIRVTLRGEANSIYPILENDIEVFVDMNEFDTPGEYTVPVQWQKKGTALGVDPLQITVDPMEITISLDRKISKFVPLTASFQGQVESGFTMTSYSLNPAQVIVDGPAELMWDISEILTEPIDLDGRRSDFSATVNILNRDPLMIIRGNGTTEFHGIIKQIIPVRNISNIPITITGLMDGLSGELETKAGSIHLEGETQNELDKFSPPPDFLKVDCSGIGAPGTYVLRVISGSGDNMNLTIDPDEVTIKISAVQENEKP